jgi:hypothetical protein
MRSASATRGNRIPTLRRSHFFALAFLYAAVSCTALGGGKALRYVSVPGEGIQQGLFNDVTRYTFGGLALENGSKRSIIIESVRPVRVETGLRLTGTGVIPLGGRIRGVLQATCGPLPLTDWGSVDVKGFELKPGRAMVPLLEFEVTTTAEALATDLSVRYHFSGERKAREQRFKHYVGTSGERAGVPCTKEDRDP